MLAVDAATGEVRWTVERRSQRLSYSVPCVCFARRTGRELLMFTNWQHGFTVVDPKNGSVVAEKSVFNTDVKERAISSPIVATDDGLIIGTCGFTNNPKHCVAVRLAGDELQEVWRIEKSVPHIPSVIAVGESTYLWDDQGIVTCVETKTGETRWRARAEAEGDFFGSPVSDGEKIFCADKEGNVSVIAVSDEGLEQLAFNRLGDDCGTTPAIAGGVMYLRTYQGLMAVKGEVSGMSEKLIKSIKQAAVFGQPPWWMVFAGGIDGEFDPDFSRDTKAVLSRGPMAALESGSGGVGGESDRLRPGGSCLGRKVGR